MDTFQLQKIANEVRKDIIRMLAEAESGHPAGSLGVTDVLVALYFGIMNHDAKRPGWEDRDRLILSNGHVCPAQYSVMARAGYFPTSELVTYAKFGSRLQAHPERTKLAGIETTSGPLGCGLAQASGIAIAARADNRHFRVFCIVSDAEHNEGNHWEAVLFAAKYKLSNLTLFIDKNDIQIDGTTEEIMPLESLSAKYRAFNWNVIEINGHEFAEIFDAVKSARSYYQGPTAIVANTIAGKGVSFMEGDWQWHAKAPDEAQAKIALQELTKAKP